MRVSKQGLASDQLFIADSLEGGSEEFQGFWLLTTYFTLEGEDPLLYSATYTQAGEHTPYLFERKVPFARCVEPVEGLVHKNCPPAVHAPAQPIHESVRVHDSRCSQL